MKKKKNVTLIIFLILICLVYIVVLYFVSGIKDATKGYIIVSNLGGYYCEFSDCTFTTKEEIDFQDKEFKIYQNNNLKGIYNLSLQDRWNLFKNGSWTSVYGDFLGVEESLNVELFHTRYEKLKEEDYLKLKIQNVEELDNDEKLVLDIDKNGVEDYFISLSNQTENNKSNQYFSSLYLVLNNKLIKIYNETTNDIYSLPFYNVFSVFQLDNKKNPKIIINKGYYDSIGEPSIIMLELNGKKVKEIVADSAK